MISPDLTPRGPGRARQPRPGDRRRQAARRAARHGVIYAIAPSRLADRDLWVGTDDGLVWRTRDEGAHWQRRHAGRRSTPWSKVGIIDASHFDAETAYVAVDRHRLDDFTPVRLSHARRRAAPGRWSPAGIPDGSFVNVVREDPVRRGLLYAGTEKGVYVSFDDGDHWQPLQINLPVTSVRDIDVHGNDVVIAHARPRASGSSTT